MVRLEPAPLGPSCALVEWMDGHDAMRLWWLIETSERQEGIVDPTLTRCKTESLVLLCCAWRSGAGSGHGAHMTEKPEYLTICLGKQERKHMNIHS